MKLQYFVYGLGGSIKGKDNTACSANQDDPSWMGRALLALNRTLINGCMTNWNFRATTCWINTCKIIVNLRSCTSPPHAELNVPVTKVQRDHKSPTCGVNPGKDGVPANKPSWMEAGNGSPADYGMYLLTNRPYGNLRLITSFKNDGWAKLLLSLCCLQAGQTCMEWGNNSPQNRT